MRGGFVARLARQDAHAVQLASVEEHRCEARVVVGRGDDAAPALEKGAAHRKVARLRHVHLVEMAVGRWAARRRVRRRQWRRRRRLLSLGRELGLGGSRGAGARWRWQAGRGGGGARAAGAGDRGRHHRLLDRRHMLARRLDRAHPLDAKPLPPSRGDGPEAACDEITGDRGEIAARQKGLRRWR